MHWNGGLLDVVVPQGLLEVHESPSLLDVQYGLSESQGMFTPRLVP